MHKHIRRRTIFLFCFRNEGSGAKQCSGFEGKISKSELCKGTAAELLHYCVSKPNHDIYCVCYGTVEQSMVKARAGAPFWSKTLSGSSDLESNLERELRFGAKPWAGAHVWSQTSSGSAFGLSRAKYAMHGVVEGSGEQKHSIYCVFACLKAQSSKVGFLGFLTFSLQIASAT